MTLKTFRGATFNGWIICFKGIGREKEQRDCSKKTLKSVTYEFESLKNMLKGKIISEKEAEKDIYKCDCKCDILETNSIKCEEEVKKQKQKPS